MVMRIFSFAEMFFPGLNRAPNFVDGFARTQFPNPLAIFRQKRNKFGKIDISGEGRLMILRRPNAILHVAAEGARPDRAQPFRVIDESQGFL